MRGVFENYGVYLAAVVIMGVILGAASYGERHPKKQSKGGPCKILLIPTPNLGFIYIPYCKKAALPSWVARRFIL